MTAGIWQDGPEREDARMGLALLRVMAEATDEQSPDWVNRRVEQLEFLDERAVRWRVSVDFNVPETAPVLRVASEQFRLVPLTSWEKDNLVAFDLRDETGTAIWLPNSAETERWLASALICWAGHILDESSAGEQKTPELKKTLVAIVSEALSPALKEEKQKRERERAREAAREAARERKQKRKRNRKPKTDGQAEEDKDPFAAVARLMTDRYGGMQAENGEDGEAVAGPYLSRAPKELAGNPSFWSQVNELWRNFPIIVAVKDKPGTRHVFKMTFESKTEFRKPLNWSKRVVQSMGWREWRLELFIGGRGGSQHLEIAAPPGVEIIRIRARPRAGKEDHSRYVVSYGGSPHVHIRIPAQRSRYLATTRVRVSRPGWLTMCWLAGLVISAVLLSAALKLNVLFSSTPESGTAATLLLALLAVVATMLVAPGAHPLASRLLWGSRILIVIDSGAVLLAAGSLLLNIRFAPWWWALFGLSVLCAVGLTGSRLFPRGPRRTMTVDRQKEQEGKREEAPEQAARQDPGSLAIPAADGYHYADDLENEWNEKEQNDLVCRLREAQIAAYSPG